MISENRAYSPIIVMMGVTASGKTIVGRALSEHLGVAFQEGDDLHPAKNVAKMREGHALTDADRAPWLERVAAWIVQSVAAAQGGVISCSALKRAYRDRLRRADPGLRFVLLNPSRSVLERRIAARDDHFMPRSLLQSQLDTLELFAADEAGLVINADEEIGAICDKICHWI